MTTYDNAYEAIAKKTGFRIPALFRKMIADGVTQYGPNREEWDANPPALAIASIHVEWYTPDAIADYEPAEYWDRSLTLVPFAQNGGGDLWCFHPAAAEGDQIRRGQAAAAGARRDPYHRPVCTSGVGRGPRGGGLTPGEAKEGHPLVPEPQRSGRAREGDAPVREARRDLHARSLTKRAPHSAVNVRRGQGHWRSPTIAAPTETKKPAARIAAAAAATSSRS